MTSIIFLRVPLRRPLLWGMVGCAVFSSQMIALGTTTELWLLLPAAFVAGAGIEIFGLGWELAMQEHVPPDMLSRVYSYDMLGSFIAIPVGQLAFGPLGAAFGIQHMILIAGLSYCAISLLTLLSRSVRIDDPRPRLRAPFPRQCRDDVEVAVGGDHAERLLDAPRVDVAGLVARAGSRMGRPASHHDRSAAPSWRATRRPGPSPARP